jgi:hypothetical protein
MYPKWADFVDKHTYSRYSVVRISAPDAAPTRRAIARGPDVRPTTLRDRVAEHIRKVVRDGGSFRDHPDNSRLVGIPAVYDGYKDSPKVWSLVLLAWILRTPIRIRHTDFEKNLKDLTVGRRVCFGEKVLGLSFGACGWSGSGRAWIPISPLSIQDTWDGLSTAGIEAMVSGWVRVGFPSNEEAVARLDPLMPGFGPYGVSHFLRIVYLCLRRRMPGDGFLPMSEGLGRRYDRLREKLGIGSVADFNSLDPTFDFDTGEVAFLVCMELAGFLG